MKVIKIEELSGYREDLEAKREFDREFLPETYRMLLVCLVGSFASFATSMASLNVNMGIFAMGALCCGGFVLFAIIWMVSINDKRKKKIPMSRLTGKPFDVYVLKRKDDENIIEEWAYVSHEERLYFTIVYSESGSDEPFIET